MKLCTVTFSENKALFIMNEHMKNMKFDKKAYNFQNFLAYSIKISIFFKLFISFLT